MGELLRIDFAAGKLVPVAEPPQPQAPEFRPAYCDPANVVVGAEYKPGVYLDVKEVAARIRKAMKAELPGVKASVRIERFSGGQAVRIGLQAVPNCEAFYVPRPEEEFINDPYAYKWIPGPEAKAAREALKEIGNRWNRQNCDGMSDYFDVQYYLTVEYDADRPDDRRFG